MTCHGHPEAVVYIRARSWCCALCGFGQMFPSLRYFHCPENSLYSTIHSLLFPPPTATHLFTVCQVLTFIKCPSWNHPVHSELRGVGSAAEHQSSESRPVGSVHRKGALWEAASAGVWEQCACLSGKTLYCYVMLTITWVFRKHVFCLGFKFTISSSIFCLLFIEWQSQTVLLLVWVYTSWVGPHATFLSSNRR